MNGFLFFLPHSKLIIHILVRQCLLNQTYLPNRPECNRKKSFLRRFKLQTNTSLPMKKNTHKKWIVLLNNAHLSKSLRNQNWAHATRCIVCMHNGIISFINSRFLSFIRMYLSCSIFPVCHTICIHCCERFISSMANSRHSSWTGFHWKCIKQLNVIEKGSMDTCNVQNERNVSLLKFHEIWDKLPQNDHYWIT